MPNGRALRGSVPLPSGLRPLARPQTVACPEPEAIPMHPPATAPRFEPALAPGARCGRGRHKPARKDARAGRAASGRDAEAARAPAVARCSGQPAGLPARPARGGVCKKRGGYGGGAATTEVGLMDGDARPCSDRGMHAYGRNGHGTTGGRPRGGPACLSDRPTPACAKHAARPST